MDKGLSLGKKPYWIEQLCLAHDPYYKAACVPTVELTWTSSHKTVPLGKYYALEYALFQLSLIKYNAEKELGFDLTELYKLNPLQQAYLLQKKTDLTQDQFWNINELSENDNAPESVTLAKTTSDMPVESFCNIQLYASIHNGIQKKYLELICRNMPFLTSKEKRFYKRQIGRAHV